MALVTLWAPMGLADGTEWGGATRHEGLNQTRICGQRRYIETLMAAGLMKDRACQPNHMEDDVNQEATEPILFVSLERTAT
jgi:hypothetical protein